MTKEQYLALAPKEKLNYQLKIYEYHYDSSMKSIITQSIAITYMDAFWYERFGCCSGLYDLVYDYVNKNKDKTKRNYTKLLMGIVTKIEALFDNEKSIKNKKNKILALTKFVSRLKEYITENNKILDESVSHIKLLELREIQKEAKQTILKKAQKELIRAEKKLANLTK